MAKLVVDQKLWFVPRHTRHASACEVSVTAVGRKWAQIGKRGRVDMETLYVDGGQYASPGRCHLSREVYEKEQSLRDAWSRFISKLSGMRIISEGVTIEDIEAAKKLLRIID
jgi:hypothetical protein